MKHTILWATVGFALFATDARAQDAQDPPAGDESGAASGSNITKNASENAPDDASSAANESNNPNTPKTEIILQNFFLPTPQGDGSRSADEVLI